MGVPRIEKIIQKIKIKKNFYERSFSHKIILNSIIMGVHRKNIQKLKLKFKKYFL